MDASIIMEYIERKHECILGILELLKNLGLPSAKLQAYIKEHNLDKPTTATKRLSVTTLVTEETKNSLPTSHSEEKQKKAPKKAAALKESKSIVEKKPDKAIQAALALLSDADLELLKAYGMRREDETSVEKARSSLPNRAELILMAHKSATEGEAEAKKQIKEMKEAKKGEKDKESKKKVERTSTKNIKEDTDKKESEPGSKKRAVEK